MGNASTREAAPPFGSHSRNNSTSSSRYRPGGPTNNDGRSSNSAIGAPSASSSSRRDRERDRDRDAETRTRNIETALLGLGMMTTSSLRDRERGSSGISSARSREEEREAREARRLEREKERERERQWSLREESCDGLLFLCTGDRIKLIDYRRVLGHSGCVYECSRL